MSPIALTIAILLAVLAAVNAWFMLRRAGVRASATLFALACLALWLSLFPPSRKQAAQPLHVFGVGSTAAKVPTDAVVLPEAEVDGGEREPDLGSALRRHPDRTRIVLHGYALSERDLDALHEERIAFAAAPLPAGLHQLQAPRWLAPGEPLRLRGRVDGIADARLELRAPDDSVLAQSALAADGGFSLEAPVRGPGRNSLELRLLRGSEPIERVPIRVAQRPSPPLRLAVLAAASNPELKYLRRWARDAGSELRTQVRLSPSVRLGERLALDPDALANTDLLIVDDRSWRTLEPADRWQAIDAVRAGLGLLLRLEQMPDAGTRALLADLGMQPIALADTSQSVADANQSPQLDRLPLGLRGPDWQTLGGEHTDAAGLWQALGRGRVGLWLLRDSYRLVLAGRADAHGRLWQEALGVLARARAEAPPLVRPDDARVGSRVTLCTASAANLIDPQGSEIGLSWQPQAGGTQTCAVFWPRLPGWHRLRTADGEWPIAIRAADEAIGLRLQRLHDATRARALTSARGALPDASVAMPGSPLPWALLWLAALAALWLLERRKR